SSAADSNATNTASSSAANSNATNTASSSAASSATDSNTKDKVTSSGVINTNTTSKTDEEYDYAAASPDGTIAPAPNSPIVASKLPSQITNFNVKVTADDGTTVLDNGGTYNVKGQTVHLQQIQLGFTLTQDGTLKSGTQVSIPVSVANNSSSVVGSALSSGTDLTVQNIGTIKYKNDDQFGFSGSYIITIGNNFEQEIGKSVTATINEKPGTSSSLVSKNSYQNVKIEVGNSIFNFIPAHRVFENETGNYSSSDFAWAPAANQINTGTVLKDPDYLNNELNSDGTNSGNTGLPSGNVINIENFQVTGSEVTKVNLSNYLGNGTLQINEDGTSLIKGDNSVDKNLPNGTGFTTIISLPKASTNQEIVTALNNAGKHSGVVINQGDGKYTVAYNFGKLTGDGSYTYHDLYPNDDAATQADNNQEVNRSDELNTKLNKTLSGLSVIHNLGVQTEVLFADSSVTNKLSGNSEQYNVDDDGTITKIASNSFDSYTTPSNGRSEGQSKITVHYVDQQGKELSSQNYGYGYPQGTTINGATPSPDYKASSKSITGYSLVNIDNPIASLSGTQLKNNTNISFKNSDQTVYYVYAANNEIAKVTYVDVSTGNELTSADLTGKFNSPESYRTTDTVNSYVNTGKYLSVPNADYQKSEYKKIVGNNAPYPTDGFVYDKDGVVKEFIVLLVPKYSSEVAPVNETIKYVDETGKEITDKPYTASENGKDVKFVTVTNPVTNTTETWTAGATAKDPEINSDGQVTTAGWSKADSNKFEAVTNPVVKGYVANEPKASGEEVTKANTPGINKTEQYTKLQQATVHYVLDKIGGKELRSTETLTGVPNQAYYDNNGKFVSYDEIGKVQTYDVPETFNQSVAGITNSNDGLLHYSYTSESNGGVFDNIPDEKQTAYGSGQDIWVIYTYSVDGKNGIDGKDGQNGVDGKNGIDGKDGQNGVDGKNGIDGKDGQNGVDGKNGIDGKDGQNGADGKNGIDGKDGQNGVDGKN
ncbi:MucBP domain-containing protein, partial [Leuconostoc suionicum]